MIESIYRLGQLGIDSMQLARIRKCFKTCIAACDELSETINNARQLHERYRISMCKRAVKCRSRVAAVQQACREEGEGEAAMESYRIAREWEQEEIRMFSHVAEDTRQRILATQAMEKQVGDALTQLRLTPTTEEENVASLYNYVDKTLECAVKLPSIASCAIIQHVEQLAAEIPAGCG